MYAKVFRSLFYGSLTGQSKPQLVFVCLLAHSDSDGHVELPRAVIATLTGLSETNVSDALLVLESPDPDSRSADLDGRRLEPAGSGRWLIVNHAKYRSMRDDDDRRRQTREAVARHRDKSKKSSVSLGKPRKAHTETDTETEAEASERDADAPSRALPSQRGCR